jgi:hypothetical protein
MREVYGSGDFRYEYVEGWGTLPAGVTFHECPGVAVDAQDNVYVLTRGQLSINAGEAYARRRERAEQSRALQGN